MRSAAGLEHPPRRSGRTSRPRKEGGDVDPREGCTEAIPREGRSRRAGSRRRRFRAGDSSELDLVGEDRVAGPAGAGAHGFEREPSLDKRLHPHHWLSTTQVGVPASPSDKQPHPHWLPTTQVRVPAERKGHRGAPIASRGGLGHDERSPTGVPAADLVQPSPRLRPRPAHIDELARVPRRYADCGGGALFRKRDPGRAAAAPSASRDSPCSSFAGLARRECRKDTGLLRGAFCLPGMVIGPLTRRSPVRSTRPR
jgi:hypothetical protein